MKVNPYFLMILFLCLSFSLITYASPKIPIKLEKIYDGDTVLVRVDENDAFSLRLKGVDCYETSTIYRAYKQAYENNLSIEDVIQKGIESKKYLEKLYENSNKNASFELFEQDKYKRNIGVLYFGKMNVNLKMINGGGCLEYVFRK